MALLSPWEVKKAGIWCRNRRGVHAAGETCLVCILANDLLHPPGREWLIQPRLKQEVAAGMSFNVGLKGQAEVCRKQNVPVFATYSVVDKDLAAVQIDLASSNFYQLTHSDGRLEHQLEHQLEH